MEAVPVLRLGDMEYNPKGKSILMVLASGDSMGFTEIETAMAYFAGARHLQLPGAEEARLFRWLDGQWMEIT